MTPRLVVSIPDPMLVQLITKRNPLGTIIHRPVVEVPAVRISPLDQNKEFCAHLETDAFGNVVKKCYNKVYMGRSGFLCKMHHDLDVKMKPQHRTIYKNEDDYDELGLRKKMVKEVETARLHCTPYLYYTAYLQWGWARQPMLFIEDEFGDLSQAFYDPTEEEME